MNTIHISFAGSFYRYEGWFFEIHRYCGPIPLNKDGEPRKSLPGAKFWGMWDRFSKLTPAEQEGFKVS